VKAARRWILFALLCSPLAGHADIIVLHDGTSYSGEFNGGKAGTLSFTDNQGIHYDLPIADVQSIVFADGVDHLTLRNGKTYSGLLDSTGPLRFSGSGGIDYQFPLRDVSTLVLSGQSPAKREHSMAAVVIPEGTEITVLTSNAIESSKDSSGQLYPAVINQDVVDSAGAVAIPSGTHAKLVVSNVRGGGAVHSPQLVLDLYSVQLHGEEYRLDSSSVKESNKSGLGLNRRTAEWTGGGAGLGALMGAVFGGGRGAGIGALAGAGGGALTQLFTRGKEIKVPAETALTFQLERTLVLHP
jgi:hypothetical protein